MVGEFCASPPSPFIVVSIVCSIAGLIGFRSIWLKGAKDPFFASKQRFLEIWWIDWEKMSGGLFWEGGCEVLEYCSAIKASGEKKSSYWNLAARKNLKVPRAITPSEGNLVFLQPAYHIYIHTYQISHLFHPPQT